MSEALAKGGGQAGEMEAACSPSGLALRPVVDRKEEWRACVVEMQ